MSTEYGDPAVALPNEILRVLVGSTAHGTGLDGAEDLDLMGIFIEPKDYVIGLKKMDQYTHRTADEGVRSTPADVDLVIYSLRKWAKLASDGNPTVLLMLFGQPWNNMITHQGWQLRKHSFDFVSQQAGRRFLGYSKSQREKLLAQKHGTNRPELVDVHGYDTKFAMHMVRLGLQGIEFLQHGQITLPMPEPERSMLRALRQGEWSLTEALGFAEHNERRLQALIDSKQTRPTANYDCINPLLVDMHEHWWETHS